MLIQRNAVTLLFDLYNPPSGNEFSSFVDKIFAYTVRSALVPNDRIWNARDTKAVHYFSGNNLVERLLPVRVRSAFDKASFSVYYLPSFFQIFRFPNVKHGIFLIFEKIDSRLFRKFIEMIGDEHEWKGKINENYYKKSF